MKQAEVIKHLKAGGRLRAHSVGNISCYRLVIGEANPVANVSESMFRRLQRTQLIKKKDHQYIFQKKSDRKIDTVEYACTFVGHGKVYRISASSVGRAKYQLWKEVKKSKPSVPYSAMRGKIYVPPKPKTVAPDIGKTVWSDRQLDGAFF